MKKINVQFLQVRCLQPKTTKENDSEPLYWQWIHPTSEKAPSEQHAYSIAKTIKGILNHTFEVYWESPSQQSDPDPQELKLLIALGDNEALHISETYEKLLGNKNSSDSPPLRPVFGKNVRSSTEPYTPRPILFVGTDDIMDLTKHEKVEEPEKEARTKVRRYMDPRFRFFDSCIWHRYISLYPAATFACRLKKIVQQLYSYKELYKTVVAKEFLEFHCRKMQQSYFMPLTSDHHKMVTPYRFHSESFMKQEADKLKKELGGFTWGCLVIDDYFMKPLRTGESEKEYNGEEPAEMSKISLIETLINGNEQQKAESKEGENTESDEDCSSKNLPAKQPKIIEILNKKEKYNPLVKPKQKAETQKGEYATSGFVDFGDKLIHTKYPYLDIILLDYFFGRGEEKVEQRYGHYLIQKLTSKLEGANIKNQKPNEVNPLGQYWIFPISVFDYAFKSHLRMAGEGNIHEKIVMADGADPVNTPELFRFMLYSFLKAYKGHHGLTFSTCLSILKEIDRHLENVGQRQFKLEVTRIKLLQVVPEITLYHTRLARLEHLGKRASYEEHISRFSKSFYELKIGENGKKRREISAIITFIGHLRYLLDQMVFGTKRDVPKMQKELILVKSLFLEIREALIKRVEKEAKMPTDVNPTATFEKIANYISILESN